MSMLNIYIYNVVTKHYLKKLKSQDVAQNVANRQ